MRAVLNPVRLFRYFSLVEATLTKLTLFFPKSVRNATSRGGSANGPRGGPDSSVSFYDLTPPPSYPVPQRPSGSYRADVVDERMRKDEIYARQLRQGSVDYIAEGSQEGRRSSQDRLRTGTFNSAVINDPAVRAQIEAMVPYRPYFMIIVTVIQVWGEREREKS